MFGGVVVSQGILGFVHCMRVMHNNPPSGRSPGMPLSMGTPTSGGLYARGGMLLSPTRVGVLCCFPAREVTRGEGEAVVGVVWLGCGCGEWGVWLWSVGCMS